MSNEQQQDNAPATLPADFFQSRKKTTPAPTSEAPTTLPADFFKQQKAKAPAPTPTPQLSQQGGVAPQPKPPTGDVVDRSLGALAASKPLQYRPRWDQPEQILKDPSWLGRTGRYIAGEWLGEQKAAIGMGIGSSKILYDLAKLTAPVPTSPEDIKVPFSGRGKAASELSKDITDVGKGFVDLGQTVWDMIRHFPEAEADPERFSQTVLNTALTVDGAVKLASKAAPLFKGNVADSTRVASNATNKAPSRFFARKTFEDVYIHTKGLEVGKQIARASDEISKEVKLHADGIAKQIDTAIPSGVIDATQQAQNIISTFDDVVKAPEKAHPVLRLMVEDARRTPPGQWNWEKVRQFRSSVGRAMGKVQGPQKAVLTQVYKQLTDSLGSTARRFNLGDSWDHYNELERKTSHQFADTIDAIKDAQSGREVAQHLSKDVALTGELSDNLAKYGLNKADVLKFVKDSTRIAKQQKGWHGTLFRMAYGSPTGIPTMLAMRGAGAGWLPSVMGGALVGYGSAGLVNMIRALRLSPDVIEHILGSRELPGRMPLGRAEFPPPLEGEVVEGPSGGAPEGGAPQLVPPGLSRLEGSALKGFLKRHPEDMARLSKVIAKGGPEAEAAKVEMRKLLQGERKVEQGPPAGQPERRVAGQLPEKAGPGVTKVAEGEVGRTAGKRPGTTKESQIGRATKARERVSKQREQAKRSKMAEAAEAQARAQAQDVNVSQFQIPELEESLREMNPKGLSALTKFRKLKGLTDDEYRGALQELILRAYEQTQ